MKKIVPPPEFSGYIELPEHITGRMFAAYWEKLQERRAAVLSEKDRLPLPYEIRWPAALALISGWGAWHIDGVPTGDLDEAGSSVPVTLLMWAGHVVDQHIAPLVDLKNYAGE